MKTISAIIVQYPINTSTTNVKPSTICVIKDSLSVPSGKVIFALRVSQSTLTFSIVVVMCSIIPPTIGRSSSHDFNEPPPLSKAATAIITIPAIPIIIPIKGNMPNRSFLNNPPTILTAPPRALNGNERAETAIPIMVVFSSTSSPVSPIDSPSSSTGFFESRKVLFTLWSAISICI